jgi:hypothetical protein
LGLSATDEAAFGGETGVFFLLADLGTRLGGIATVAMKYSMKCEGLGWKRDGLGSPKVEGVQTLTEVG